MGHWISATPEGVEALLAAACEGMHPVHRGCFDALRVPLRIVPVVAHPGESVVVVAEHEGKLLYWSDIEAGWELQFPTSEGGIEDRGRNQFALSHLMWQLFGDPEKFA